MALLLSQAHKKTQPDQWKENKDLNKNTLRTAFETHIHIKNGKGSLSSTLTDSRCVYKADTCIRPSLLSAEGRKPLPLAAHNPALFSYTSLLHCYHIFSNNKEQNHQIVSNFPPLPHMQNVMSSRNDNNDNRLNKHTTSYVRGTVLNTVHNYLILITTI